MSWMEWPAIPSIIAAGGVVTIARILAAFGMAFATYAAITELVGGVVDLAIQHMQGATGWVLTLIQLSGFIDAVGIITAAMVMRAAMVAAKVFVTTAAP